MKQRLALVLILIVAAVITRFFFLNLIPTGVNWDEIDFVLNAKTVFWGGTDISATWNPLSLKPLPNEEPKSEVLPVLLAPVLGPLPFSPFIAHLPFAILGVVLVLLVYLVGAKLFESYAAGFLAGLVVALNPLAIFNSRVGYDASLTPLFFLAAFAVLLYAKGWKIILTVPFLFLAFYGYVADKVIYLPFVVLTFGYSFFVVNHKKYIKPYLVSFILAVAIFGAFILSGGTSGPGGRMTTILTPFHESITATVDAQRRQSLQSIPITGFFVNRGTVFIDETFKRLMGAFSPSVLFSQGDTYHFYFVWKHGFFYILDAVFLFAGGFFLVRKHKKTAVFLGMLLPILVLPSIFNAKEISYAFRSFILYIFLAMIVGYGLFECLQIIPKRYKILTTVGVALVYGWLFLGFMFNYLVENPVYHEDQSQLTFRVLSRYLVEEQKNERQVTVVTLDPYQTFKQFLLYSGVYNRLNEAKIRSELAVKIQTNNYSWGNVTFTKSCDLPTPGENRTIILGENNDCSKSAGNFLEKVPDYLGVARISDSGQEFKIFSGKTCQNENLGSYLRGVAIGDLAIESLPLINFCEKFIVRNK